MCRLGIVDLRAGQLNGGGGFFSGNGADVIDPLPGVLIAAVDLRGQRLIQGKQELAGIRNLWMIYSKAPFDPESVASTDNFYQGIDYFMMPALRNIGFSLSFKF